MNPNEIVADIYTTVFFNKLKQAGVAPRDQKEMSAILAYSDKLVAKYPRGTKEASSVKSAAFDPRFDGNSNGSPYSDEVLKTTEDLMKSAKFVDAVSALLDQRS